MLLTAQSVARLKIPTGKADHIEWDEKLSGWGVRLNAGGKRSWVLQYRIAGRSTRVTFGSVGKMDADAARRQARIMLGKVEQGIDPATEKAERTKAAGVTFGRQIEPFLEHKRAQRRGRTVEEIERHLNEHWAPFHKLALGSIQRATVAARLTEIKKKQNGKGGPIAANRARATLSSFFGWAMGEGLTDHNPVIGTNRPAEETSRERVLTDAELVAIWNSSTDDDYGRIVRLLVLTGQRRSEIGDMQRAEIDRDKRMLSLPGERTKNGRPHDVPLSDDAMAALPADREGRAFLFGRLDTGFSGWGKAKRSLDGRLGKAVASWTLHDIRRTVATGMGEIGIQPHIIEAVLNHVSGHKAGVAGVYNRAAYAAEKRQALDMWAAHVAALVAGKAGNVVTLRKA